MAGLKILVPDGTINYIQNPAFRYEAGASGVDPWVAIGSTITRTLDYARFNIASMKVVTGGVLLNEGTYYRINALAGIGEPITGSAYIRGTGTVRVRLIESGGKQWVSEDLALSPTRWQRLSASGFSTGSNDIRLYVETSGNKVQATTFYVDGVQVERHPYATTYCDGDQEGCHWNVLSHGSVSIRPATTRAGGRWVSLGGCERDESNLYFTVVGGLGVAPIRNDTQAYADAPGGYFQGTKVLSRLITVTFYAKAPKKRRNTEVSLRDLHRLRQMIFDVIKPDRTSGTEEFLIEYQDGSVPVYFKARYDGGLEGEWDVRNQYVNSFPIRLLAMSPFLTEDDQEVAQLNFRERQTVNYIMRRYDGDWSEMNGGFGGPVYDIKVGSRGEIIATGNYILANNKATAIDPQIFANYIAYWDGTQWRGYGTGANGPIYSVAVAPNGDIYATGDFTSINGVACNRIARWKSHDSPPNWEALGTGLNGIGRAVAVAPNGDVYVGGSFTTAGGGVAKYVARWDGSWHYLGGNAGLNAAAYCVAISSDGSQVYFGGLFTDEFSSPGILALNFVGMYSPMFDNWEELGDGFDNTVLDLALSPTGRIYACGEFTAAGNSTGQILPYVAYWNGAQWFDMNGGSDNIVRAIDVSPVGEVLAVGDFLRMGSSDVAYSALWNGSNWVGLDINIGAAQQACLFDKQGNIYMGSGVMVDYAKMTNITNRGSAEVSPLIYIKGPAVLKWIENQTARRRLYADLTILDNEEVFFDFAHGNARSTVRGDLAYAILPGSDFRSWKLLPGDNEILALMENDVVAKMQISYVPRHWSADATERTESF